MNFYKSRIELNNWKEYKRIIQWEEKINIENIKWWILKDVFFKIEWNDLESVKKINFEEIDENTLTELRNRTEYILLTIKDWFLIRK